MTSTGSFPKSVIIFDDDEDILSICSYILEELGWQVHVFTNCNDIVDRVTQIRPTVILMDNWIPEDGGIVATQKLKNSDGLKHIPVIYFSANAKVEALAAEAGAESYLAKPFELEDLERAVNTAVQRFL